MFSFFFSCLSLKHTAFLYKCLDEVVNYHPQTWDLFMFKITGIPLTVFFLLPLVWSFVNGVTHWDPLDTPCLCFALDPLKSKQSLLVFLSLLPNHKCATFRPINDGVDSLFVYYNCRRMYKVFFSSFKYYPTIHLQPLGLSMFGLIHYSLTIMHAYHV